MVRMTKASVCLASNEGTSGMVTPGYGYSTQQLDYPLILWQQDGACDIALIER